MTGVPQPSSIVGIGASAGGLEALQALFHGLPDDLGFAYVIVQHLSPDHKSMMGELLARHTDMPIREVEDGVGVEPNAIYLMPPRKAMRVDEGCLRLEDVDDDDGLSLPIDEFLHSLATELGERAIAIILSGTGSDGSRGIRTVYEQGGLVIAQSESSAKFTGMPRSAIDTGIVDLMLTPEEMQTALTRYARRSPGERIDVSAPDDLHGLADLDATRAIFDLLRRETGVDFAVYKSPTVARRLDRRLLATGAETLEAYLDILRQDHEERRRLYHDLLIRVTRFFRDPEAFEILEKDVLPGLIDDLDDAEELRIWVPGCSTGDEAYSLAMLALDAFARRGMSPRLKVFATDVDRAATERASAGLYEEDALASVPDDVVDKYFVREGDEWRVAPSVRSNIVFAHHNVLRDAPFTRLQLVSCRNLLIYFGTKAQRRALALFDFALKKDGVLFLGPSESLGELAEDFDLVDHRWKIYRKRTDQSRRLDLALSHATDRLRENVETRPQRSEDVAEPGVQAARGILSTFYGPPSLLVDRDLRLIYAFNGGGRYITQRDGAASRLVPELLDASLRLTATTGLRRALDEGRGSTQTAIVGPESDASALPHDDLDADEQRDPEAESENRAGQEEVAQKVRISAHPVPANAGAGPWALLCIEEIEPVEADAVDLEQIDVERVTRERIEKLEKELAFTRQNLQSTVEEMDASNEELQATNEELTASNEELQSTNEELQSVNEELYTVNAEYQTKIAELTEVTSDMNHLLEATEVHTIFLDEELSIRKFTPRIAEVFQLLPRDIGRPIDGFAHRLDHEGLVADLQSVVDGGPRVEHEVADEEGNVYFLRILPYCPGEEVEGVLLTLIDMSALRETEDELERSKERYRTLARVVAPLLWTSDEKGRFTSPQEAWTDYTGQSWGDQKGYGWLDMIHEDDRDRIEDAWRNAVENNEMLDVHGRLWSDEHQTYRHFEMRAAPVIEGEGGLVREWVGNIDDIEEPLRHAERLTARESELRSILDASPVSITVKDVAGHYRLASRVALEMLGRERDDVIGKTDHDLLPLDRADAVRAHDRRAVERREPVETLETHTLDDGGERTVKVTRFPVFNPNDGSVNGIATVGADITEQKRAETLAHEAIRRRDEFIAMMSHELRNPLGGILNATYVLSPDTLADEKQRRARAIIKRQSLHMARLLDDLLDVARVQHGRIQLEKAYVDMRNVARRVLETMMPRMEAADIEPRIAFGTEPLIVYGDEDRLVQVQTNLLRNAIKFTPASGMIHFELERDGDDVVTRVRDNGVGLEQEELDRIFDLFYQRDSSLDRSEGGLGVGLSLVRSLIELHEGSVDAQSDGAGQGTTFEVRLPLVDDKVRPEDCGHDAELDEGHLKIAIVEDDRDSREMLVTLLETEGHTVVAAEDGASGVDLILGERPHVALVDIGLPRMDGYEVARRIREEREKTSSRLRLIALTGYGRERDQKQAREAGFDAHMIKPVRIDALIELLEDVASDGRSTT